MLPPASRQALEAAFTKLRKSLADELLQQVLAMPPTRFEQLVIDLLLKMGCGGSRLNASEAIGHSGDSGIDGIIKEDKLGRDVIYIHAKRWSSTVGRSEVQAFAGALEGHPACLGVFITTSQFTQQASEYVPTSRRRLSSSTVAGSPTS